MVSQSQPGGLGPSDLEAGLDAEPSALVERLARWIDPTAFATHRMSSRNRHATNLRRSYTIKLAKKVLKFRPIAKALSASPASPAHASDEVPGKDQ